MKFHKQALSAESSMFLNVVRLVACELVVLGHFLTKYQPVPFDGLFRLGSVMGGAAVLLFFVLSGLLISYSLINKLENPQYGFRSYFVDRFSRIYSGLIPALLLSAAIAAAIYVTNYTYFTELSTMQSAPSPLTFGMTLLMLERFPVGFFNSLLSGFGVSFPLPEVTPFGFNGILWTLVLEWWIYIFFGALVIGAAAYAGSHRERKNYKLALFAVAALVGLLLVGFFDEFSGVIIVWFVGAAMMMALSSETLRNRLSSDAVKKALGLLFALCLAAAAFAVYATWAWTTQYYNVYLGLALSACVFLSVLLLNSGGLRYASKLMLKKPSAKLIATGAGYSYTLFLIHYPIIILLNGFDLPVNRFIMLIPILLITNLTAFAIAYFTERKHKQLAAAIKKLLHLPST